MACDQKTYLEKQDMPFKPWAGEHRPSKSLPNITLKPMQSSHLSAKWPGRSSRTFSKLDSEEYWWIIESDLLINKFSGSRGL